jgi:hypothetical protein
VTSRDRLKLPLSVSSPRPVIAQLCGKVHWRKQFGLAKPEDCLDQPPLKTLRKLKLRSAIPRVVVAEDWLKPYLSRFRLRHDYASDW